MGAVVDRRGGVQPNARVSVFVVVVREEVLAEDPGVLEAPEACGERRQYFRVLKFASENGLSHVGSRVAPRHAEVHHQLADRFGAHGPAAIGVDRERAAGDPLGENRVLDELLGELGVLVRRDQPVENIATEDVEDHVEVVEEASGRTVEFGNVPAPNFIGMHGQQLGSLLGRMGALGPSVTRRTAAPQQPVHGRGRAAVDALVESARVN